jgi:hypothetical protein
VIFRDAGGEMAPVFRIDPNCPIRTRRTNKRNSVNAMLIETSPIYDALVGEMGNPVPAPMDCSWEATLAAAAAPAAEPVSLPVKRQAAKAFAPKQMAAS